MTTLELIEKHGIGHNCLSDAYELGRKDAIEEFEKTKIDVLNWLIKRQSEGYGTTNGELLDHIYDIAKQLKEQKNE